MKEQGKDENSGKEAIPLREILITTDGEKINLVKAEVSGSIELVAILQNMLRFVIEEQGKSKA